MEGDPKIDSVLIESIQGLLKNHNYTQANELVEKIDVELKISDPQNVEFHLLKAKVFGSFGVGRGKEGYQIYLRLLNKFPENVGADIRHSTLLQICRMKSLFGYNDELGDFLEFAKKTSKTLLERDAAEKYLIELDEIYLLYYTMNRISDAFTPHFERLETYYQKIDDNANLGRIHANIAGLRSYSNYEDAMYHFNMALEYKNEAKIQDPILLKSIAGFYRHYGKYREAERQYQEAIQMAEQMEHPLIGVIGESYGEFLITIGELSRGKILLESLSSKYQSPNKKIWYLNQYGKLLARMGKREDAINVFEEAIEIKLEDQNLPNRLGPVVVDYVHECKLEKVRAEELIELVGQDERDGIYSGFLRKYLINIHGSLPNRLMTREYFEQFSDYELIKKDHNLAILALKTLADLYLMEYKLEYIDYPENAKRTLTKLDQIMIILTEIAGNNTNHVLEVQVKLLRFKIAIIESRLLEANTTLQDIKSEIKRYGWKMFDDLVEKFDTLLMSETMRLESLTHQDDASNPLQQKLLEEYIRNVKKVFSL